MLLLLFVIKLHRKYNDSPLLSWVAWLPFGVQEFCFFLGWLRELEALLNMCLLLLLYE